MLDAFHLQAAEIALKNLFEKSYFSISELDKLLKLLNCIPDKQDYLALSMLHCVEYSAMSPGFRDQLMLKVANMLQSKGFDTEILNGRLVNAIRITQEQGKG